VILAARFRAGEIWLSYERFADHDDLFWNATRTSRFRFKSFGVDPPASQEVCESRIDVAARHISGPRDAVWRVRVNDGPAQAPFVGELGQLVALDERGNATIRFERGELDDAIVPVEWLWVDTSAIPWP
jgi:hypothetical protein